VKGTTVATVSKGDDKEVAVLGLGRGPVVMVGIGSAGQTTTINQAASVVTSSSGQLRLLGGGVVGP
jgi:hypothetical protein